MGIDIRQAVDGRWLEVLGEYDDGGTMVEEVE
jgi:ribosomal protein S16